MESDSDSEELVIEWIGEGRKGKKSALMFYDAVMVDNVEYKKYDCVYLNPEEGDDPYVGKIVRMWENNKDEKKMLVRWFFRPKEVDSHANRALTREIRPRPDDKEVFISFPKREVVPEEEDGDGVENTNSLEVIMKKVTVLCTSLDRRNRQPSKEEIAKADHIFYRTYDTARRKVVPNLRQVLDEFQRRSYVQSAEEAIFNRPVPAPGGHHSASIFNKPVPVPGGDNGAGQRNQASAVNGSGVAVACADWDKMSAEAGEEGGHSLDRSYEMNQDKHTKGKSEAVGGLSEIGIGLSLKGKDVVTGKETNAKRSAPGVDVLKMASIRKEGKALQQGQEPGQAKSVKDGQKVKLVGGVEVSRKRPREEDPRKGSGPMDLSVKKARTDGLTSVGLLHEKELHQVSKMQKIEVEPGKGLASQAKPQAESQPHSTGIGYLKKLKETGPPHTSLIKKRPLSGGKIEEALVGSKMDKKEVKAFGTAKKVDKSGEKLASQVVNGKRLMDSAPKVERSNGDEFNGTKGDLKNVSRQDEEEKLRKQALESMSLKKRNIEKSGSMKQAAGATLSNDLVKAESKRAACPAVAVGMGEKSESKTRVAGLDLTSVPRACDSGARGSRPVAAVDQVSVGNKIGAAAGLLSDRNRDKVIKQQDVVRKSTLGPSKSSDKKKPMKEAANKTCSDAYLSKGDVPGTELATAAQPQVANQVRLVTKASAVTSLASESSKKTGNLYEESKSTKAQAVHKTSPTSVLQAGDSEKNIESKGPFVANRQQKCPAGADLPKTISMKAPPDKLMDSVVTDKTPRNDQMPSAVVTKPSPDIVKRTIEADAVRNMPLGGTAQSGNGLASAQDIARGKTLLAVATDGVQPSLSANPTNPNPVHAAMRPGEVKGRPVGKEPQTVARYTTGSNAIPVGVKVSERDLVAKQPEGASIDQGPESVFKPRAWPELLKQAVELGRALFVENIHPAIDSSVFQDSMKMIFPNGTIKDARISPHRAPGVPLSACGYVVFTTKKAAEEALQLCTEKCLILTKEIRPLRVTMAVPPPPPLPSFLGHLNLLGARRPTSRDDQKVASATSHPSQPNTLEFEMALEWRVLQEKHSLADMLLKEKHEAEIAEVIRLYGGNL